MKFRFRGAGRWAGAAALCAQPGGLGRIDFPTAATGPARVVIALQGGASGGRGSWWGRLAGVIALGLAQALGAQVNPEFSVLAGHLLFLAVLVVRYGGAMPSLRRLRSAR